MLTTCVGKFKMEILGIVILSIYISSVLVSLLLVTIVRSWLKSNTFFTVKGKQVRVKYPYLIVISLILISTIPVINTVMAYKLLCKIIS